MSIVKLERGSIIPVNILPRLLRGFRNQLPTPNPKLTRQAIKRYQELRHERAESGITNEATGQLYNTDVYKANKRT